MHAPLWPRRRFTQSLAALVGASLAPRSAAARPSAAAEAGPGAALIDLSSNENPYGPSPQALEAMTRCQSVACRYPDEAEQRVVEAIARLHDVAPERVVLGCGSSEILRLSDAAFLGPDRRLVVAEPTFEAVLQYAKVTKAEAVKLPLDSAFRHDLEAMAAACDDAHRARVPVQPQQPHRHDRARRRARGVPGARPDDGGGAGRRGLPPLRRGPGLPERGGAARAPSRTWWWHARSRRSTAWRACASATRSRSLANAEALRAQAAWGNTNIAVLEAALASLQDAELVSRQRERLNGTRRSLCRALDEDGRRYIPSEANFLMIDVGADTKPLIPAFEARGVKVGRRFAAMPGWLRVTIGKPEESAAFLSALRELVPARAAA